MPPKVKRSFIPTYSYSKRRRVEVPKYKKNETESKDEQEVGERKFKNEKLRIEALTHKSYVFENPMTGNHNERLEFLGDAVISSVVADYLYGRFNNYNEGQLSMLRSNLVCRQTLSQFALQLGLNNHLKLGTGAINSNARNSEKILEDAFEAYIGALFLDSGKNYSEVMDFMLPLLAKRVDKIIEDSIATDLITSNSSKPVNEPAGLPYEDPINRLQTWSQRRGFGMPQYAVSTENNKEFTFEVVINGELYGKGTARNKKEAKKKAAISALPC